MHARTRIKVCGITRVQDATAALEMGVDAIGLNFYPRSSRFVRVESAREIVACAPLLTTVGVFVDESAPGIRDCLARTGVSVAQLHGDEPAEWIDQLDPIPVIRAFRWRGPDSNQEISKRINVFSKPPIALLLDTYRPDSKGGTGESWDWTQAKSAPATIPLIVAGGLTPENVAAAIQALRPFAVDVAGGVESAPGIKDHGKIREFVEAVREADASRS